MIVEEFNISSSIGSRNFMRIFIILILSAAVAGTLTDIIFHYLNFEYSVFEDPFDVMKFILDIGLYMLIFIPLYLFSKRLAEKK